MLISKMKGLRNSLMIDTISDTICDEKIVRQLSVPCFGIRLVRSPSYRYYVNSLETLQKLFLLFAEICDGI